jgi:hypothetical protein
MKQRILVVALTAAILGMTACSSNPNITSGNTQAISDQRLATSEFRRQGVRLTYSLSGEVEAIEVTGYAAVWGNSQNAEREAYRVAELEAKKSLNDFINKETISSSVSVRMISQNLEHAQDQKSNRTTSNNRDDSDNLVAVDAEVAPTAGNAGNVDQDDNSTLRKDALKIASRVSTTITTQNRGILGGLYQVDGQVINDGKTVQVVYRWDRKHNVSRLQIRNMMSM